MYQPRKAQSQSVIHSSVCLSRAQLSGISSPRDGAEAHVQELRDQVAAIIREGVTEGEFKVADPDAAATAVLGATIRFHHPHHVKESQGRIDPKEIRTLLKLVLAGLRTGAL